MGSHRHHHHLSAIPGNVADFATALGRLPYALVWGGIGIANKFLAGPPESGCGCGPRIERCPDGSIIRHHYRVCCVPSRHRCGGSCT